jgi:hypothetical protein
MITYPVDTKKRYSVYSILTGGVVIPDTLWPRADGGQIIGSDPDLVLLLNIDEPPDYDSETHSLTITGWTADLVAQTYTCEYAVEPKQLLRVTARAALRAVWDNLPAYIRGPYRPQFEAANRLLDDGHDEEAAALILYASACPDYDQDQIEAFNAAKSTLLDEIESLIDDQARIDAFEAANMQSLAAANRLLDEGDEEGAAAIVAYAARRTAEFTNEGEVSAVEGIESQMASGVASLPTN